MLKALLVDDEPNNLDSLAYMLTRDCTGVTVAGKVQNADEARTWLSENDANVIFLDIQMPGETGFDLLNSLDVQNLQVVFVTAHNEYALRAIKASAVDYLLKPVNIAELQKAVEKVKRTISSLAAIEQQQQLVQRLLSMTDRKAPPQKIALPRLGGMTFIEVEDIVSLQADSNYTIIHLKGMQKIVVSKTMKDFEELLDENQFIRIHKSYLVNLKCVSEYSSSDGGIVKMSDGNHWSVSRRQLDVFHEKMRAASLMFGYTNGSI